MALRPILVFLLSTLLVCASSSLNFVILLADDVGFGDVGYHNNSRPITPNIDAMSKSKHSIVFTNFHSASPLCSPSRAAIMSGRNPHRDCIDFPFHTQYNDGKGKIKGLRHDLFTIADAVHKSSDEYITAHIGKWQLGVVDSLDAEAGVMSKLGFDYGMGSFRGIYSNDNFCLCGDISKKRCYLGLFPGKIKRNCRSELYDIQAQKVTSEDIHIGSAELYINEFEKLLELANSTDKSFYVQIHFNNAHSPVSGSRESTSLVCDLLTEPLPDRNAVCSTLSKKQCNSKYCLYDDETKQCGVLECQGKSKTICKSKEYKEGCEHLPGRGCVAKICTNINLKRDWREMNLRASMYEMDLQIGRVRQLLLDYGVADNTFVIFTSDNGATLQAVEDSGYNGKKGSINEGGHRVPTIIEWPDVITTNRWSDALLSQMDIFPTVLEILDVQSDRPQDVIDGISFLPLLVDENTEWERVLVVCSSILNTKPCNKIAYYYKNFKSIIGTNNGNYRKLYNLTADKLEENDISKENKELFSFMEKLSLKEKESINKSRELFCDGTHGKSCADLTKKECKKKTKSYECFYNNGSCKSFQCDLLSPKACKKASICLYIKEQKKCIARVG